jgi:hypothetical protein
MEIAVQKSSTYWIVSITMRANKIFLRAYWEEGGRCCTVTAIRYYAGGINAKELAFQSSSARSKRRKTVKFWGCFLFWSCRM